MFMNPGGETELLVNIAQFVDKNTNASIIDIKIGNLVLKLSVLQLVHRWLLDPDRF